MSEWKQEAAARRDFRAAAGGEEDTKPSPSSKNRRLWCRGKVGQSHDYQFERTLDLFGVLKPVHIFRCSQCGRKNYRDSL
jgi:hypothetical protein